MPKLKSMAILTPLLLVFAMLFASPAMAQNAQTWMPESNNFDPTQHCYLDPQLTGSVDLSGCEQKLKDAGRAHGYEFYFIMTVQGSEPNGSTTRQKFAAWKLDQYVLTVGKKLPSDKYVIVLVVRSKTNSSQRSLAGQGGNELQKYGLDDTYFNAAGGPLATNNKTYLPNDPKGFALAVADDVNKATDKFLADQKQREEEAQRQKEEAEREAQRKAEEARRLAEQQAAHDRQVHTVVVTVGIAVPMIAVLILVAVLFLRRRNWKSKALAKIAAVRGKVDSTNSFYTKLRGSFREFLDDRKNWRETLDPTGSDYADYEKALNAYTEFSVRNVTALSLVGQAEELVKKASPWAIWTVAEYAEAIALLSTKEIVITGDEVELKEVHAVTGGTLKKTTYKPDELLSSIDALFNEANTGLQNLFEAYQASDKNKKDIEGLLATVEKTKGKLSQKGLVFAPYQARYDELKKAQQGFLAIINSNPSKAVKSSEAVEFGIQQLEQALEAAIAFKESLDTATETSIAAAEKRVAEVRGQSVQYRYQLAAGEFAPESLTGAKLLLNEDGANPDRPIADARTHLSEAVKAVLAADLAGAGKEKAAAEQQAQSALALVDTVLKTKAQVEKLVTPVRTNLEKLTADIPAASQAETELKAEFLQENFKGEPEKLANARSVANSTGAELAKVKKAYDEQRFQAALTRVEKLAGDIRTATEQLADVASRLAKLRELKQRSKATIAAAAQLSGTLTDKLKVNDFTTSAETDSAFARLAPSLEQQQTDVKKDITDWPVAAISADKLLASYQQVARSVDGEKAQHANAESELRTLVSAVASAQGFVKDTATLQPAIDKMSEARGAMADVQKRIAQKKSDWAAIARRAKEAISVATTAEQLSKADRRNYDQAVSNVQALASAVSSAQTYVNDSATRQPAIDKMGEARTALTAVQGQIAVPKSDWAGIAQRAKDGAALANAAADLAKTDRRNYDQAVATINGAAQTVRNTRSEYDRGVSADLGKANGQLRAARTALSNGKYEDAADYAGSVSGLAATAVEFALAAVATIIAEEQRLAREAAERGAAQERAEREAAQREAAQERSEREAAQRQAAQERAEREATQRRSQDRDDTPPPVVDSPREDDSKGRSGDGVDKGNGRSGDGVGDF